MALNGFVTVLVSLHEARREILRKLDTEILPRFDQGLGLDEFEFLLAVAGLKPESANAVSTFKLQRELHLSSTTIHRRIQGLSRNNAWIEDSGSSMKIQMSREGLGRWIKLMNLIRQQGVQWFQGTQREDAILHLRWMSELRTRVLSRKFRPRDSLISSSQTNLKTEQNLEPATSLLTDFEGDSPLLNLLEILRSVRLLTPHIRDLAIREKLSLNRADLLVILALLLPSGFIEPNHESLKLKQKLTAHLSLSSTRNEAWLPFADLARALVHTVHFNQSIFSKTMTQLSGGEFPLVETGPWDGRSKAARITAEGYHRIVPIWEGYRQLAEELSTDISTKWLAASQTIQNHLSIQIPLSPTLCQELEPIYSVSSHRKSHSSIQSITPELPTTESDPWIIRFLEALSLLGGVATHIELKNQLGWTELDYQDIYLLLVHRNKIEGRVNGPTVSLVSAQKTS